MKSWNPEVIRSTTPLVLAAVGAVIGVLVVVKDMDTQKATAAFGLAGTAIAGAAGLAQSGKNESETSIKQGDNSQITPPSSEPTQQL